jgi:hypothetical protein
MELSQLPNSTTSQKRREPFMQPIKVSLWVQSRVKGSGFRGTNGRYTTDTWIIIPSEEHL